MEVAQAEANGARGLASRRDYRGEASGARCWVTPERQVPDEGPGTTLMTQLAAADERLGDRLDRERGAKERREAERASTDASAIVLRTEFETTDAAVCSEVATA